MNVWLLIRVAFLAFVAISSCFVPLGPQASPALSWQAVVAIFAFCPIALFIVLGVQVLNPRSAKMWHRPSWRLNPFNFREPMQFFHLGAYAFFVQGVVTLARLLPSSVPFYAEALVPFAMGFGVLLGLWLCSLVFRSKVAAQPSLPPDGPAAASRRQGRG